MIEGIKFLCLEKKNSISANILKNQKKEVEKINTILKKVEKKFFDQIVVMKDPRSNLLPPYHKNPLCGLSEATTQ